MSLMEKTYAVYVLLSVLLTIWVAHTLHKNGRVFLVDAFAGNEALADSINHLLVVGFYLVNLGYVALALKLGHRLADATDAVESLSTKLGFVLVVLGGMHFFNLFLFSRMRKASLRRAQYAPIAPPARADEWSSGALGGS